MNLIAIVFYILFLKQFVQLQSATPNITTIAAVQTETSHNALKRLKHFTQEPNKTANFTKTLDRG